MTPNGRARVEDTINDVSVLYGTKLTGISAVIGKCQRAPKDYKTKLVGNWNEFRKWFGEEFADSDFPTYCKRILDAGAKIRVGTIHHYVDGVPQGTRATKQWGHATFTAVSVGAWGNSVSLSKATARSGTANKVDITVSFAGFPELTRVVREITDPLSGQATSAEIAKFNAECEYLVMTSNTYSNGAIVTSSKGAGGTGYLVNNTFTVSTGSTLATGRVDSVSSGAVATYTILTAGAGYSTGSGVATVATSGSGSGFTVNILSVTSVPTSVTLATGAEDLSTVDDADWYNSSEFDGQGFRQFDEATDFVRIAAPEIAIPIVDEYLIAYVNARKDCRAILRTPMYLSGTTAISYREMTGDYDAMAGVPDTHMASMVFGDIQVADTLNGNGQKWIHGIADYMAKGGLKDTTDSKFMATAGAKRGKIKGVSSVFYNLATKPTEFDSVVNGGINPIIMDEDFGAVIWNNNTLQKSATLLINEEISEVLIYIRRNINPLIKGEIFDPNDPITWSTIYKKCRPVLETIKKGRGLRDFIWQGDQFADSVADCVVNSSENLDAGEYKIILWLKPMNATKYVGYEVRITNSSVDFSSIGGQPE